MTLVLVSLVEVNNSKPILVIGLFSLALELSSLLRLDNLRVTNVDISKIDNYPKDSFVLVPYGSNKSRLDIINTCIAKGYVIGSYVAPSVTRTNYSVGSGTIIFPNVYLGYNTTIGSNCIVMHGSTISHDCKVLDNTYISPDVSIASFVTIESNCMVGINATIKPRCKLRDSSTLGAGSVLTKTFCPNSILVKNPSEPL